MMVKRGHLIGFKLDNQYITKRQLCLLLNPLATQKTYNLYDLFYVRKNCVFKHPTIYASSIVKRHNLMFEGVPSMLIAVYRNTIKPHVAITYAVTNDVCDILFSNPISNQPLSEHIDCMLAVHLKQSTIAIAKQSDLPLFVWQRDGNLLFTTSLFVMLEAQKHIIQEAHPHIVNTEKLSYIEA